VLTVVETSVRSRVLAGAVYQWPKTFETSGEAITGFEVLHLRHGGILLLLENEADATQARA
jgi:hypothetical protein